MSVYFPEAFKTCFCSIWTLCFDSSDPCLPASDARNVAAIRPVNSNQSCSIVGLCTAWGKPVQYTVNQQQHSLSCLAALDARKCEANRPAQYKRLHVIVYICAACALPLTSSSEKRSQAVCIFDAIALVQGATSRRQGHKYSILDVSEYCIGRRGP